MYPNDITYLSYDWQVFHSMGKESDQAKLDSFLTLISTAKRLIDNLKGTNIPLGALIWMSSIHDHTVDAYGLFLSNFCIAKHCVDHFGLFIYLSTIFVGLSFSVRSTFRERGSC